jgi:hypothetical protein
MEKFCTESIRDKEIDREVIKRYVRKMAEKVKIGVTVNDVLVEITDLEEYIQ